MNATSGLGLIVAHHTHDFKVVTHWHALIQTLKFRFFIVNFVVVDRLFAGVNVRAVGCR